MKLNRLNGDCDSMLCTGTVYQEMLASLPRFRTIKRLKKILKKKGLNLYYPYIYRIYRDRTGKSVVRLTRRQRTILINDFMKLNRVYKSVIGNRNMLNYNFLLYMMCKYHNMKTVYKYILLPNKNTMKKLLNVWNNNNL